MTFQDETFRRDPPLAGEETDQVIGSLERQRAIFAWKCANLDGNGLRATLGPSAMTLGGLLKHLALVEDTHFARLLLDQPPGAPWNTVDWDADPDWDWHSAAGDTPEQLYTLWAGAVARSRAVLARALSGGGLDQLGKFTNRDGQAPSLRRIVFDLTEEYARHAGHADLLRESVDGLVGEDPPARPE